MSDDPTMDDEDSGLDLLSPAGQGDWVVEDGDSVDAIADQVGHFWQTIWDDPANADLKAVRDNRNILMPGDKLTIPALRPKTETRETDLIHQFKRKGVPLIIRFEAVDARREPYANCEYTLTAGRRRYQGVTDDKGRLEQYVSSSAKLATLIVTLPAKDGKPARSRTWKLRIGGLRPANSVAGCQARLRNLGFSIDRIDGEFGPQSEAAVLAFQRQFGLEMTGELDDATVTRIEEEHGS